MKTGYDASEPPANPPTVDVVAFYGGGDTPHVWALAEIEASPCRYRLPIYVRSDPAAASPNVDAATFIAWLSSIGAPPCPVVLDLETAISTSYVNAFGTLLREAGFTVLPYGSSGNLFFNPKLDGYWVDLPGADAIPSNCVGVQYAQGGGGTYDLSWWEDSVPFWDTTPVIVGKGDMLTPNVEAPKGQLNKGQLNVHGDIYHWWQGGPLSPWLVEKLGVFSDGASVPSGFFSTGNILLSEDTSVFGTTQLVVEAEGADTFPYTNGQAPGKPWGGWLRQDGGPHP